MYYLTEMAVLRQRKRVDEDLLKGPIKSAEQVVALFRAMEDEGRVKVVALYLNGLSEAIGYEVVGLGDDAEALIDVPGILRGALSTFASAVILVLNHPQINGLPTPHERKTIKKLDMLTKELGIVLRDVIIFNEHGVYSRQNEIAVEGGIE